MPGTGLAGFESDLDPNCEETWSTTASSTTPHLFEDPPVVAAPNSSPSKKRRPGSAPARRKRPTSSSRSSLIIFDWDDTLLPTSFLSKHGYRLDSPNPVGELKDALDEYSDFINRTLADARKHGHVIIVTNAETGWIKLTVEKFLPKCTPVVMQLQQMSARSMFEPTGITAPIAWKENAFRLVIEEYIAASLVAAVQVVSLGDSAHEREAALKVCAELNVVCKSLKFMERPDLDALTKQHLLIQDCLADIVSRPEHLDLCIQTNPPAETVKKVAAKTQRTRGNSPSKVIRSV